MEALTKLNLPSHSFTRVKSGKVREIYDGGKYYLFVATDRISAFDVVLPNGIPRKGEVLNKLSLFWFEMLEDIVDNHVVKNFFPDQFRMYHELEGRSVIVKKAKPFPVECVVRGYLAGSGWKEYQQTGRVCGIELPEGLVESSKLPEPIFTPATKEELGKHDINITLEQMRSMVGKDLAYHLRDMSLQLYSRATEYALQRGIIIADTKFEFGDVEGNDAVRDIILIDEVLTPDSSRFWPAGRYSPGKPQESFDKQFVRDYLEGIKWNKQPPAPELPEEVVMKTSEKYVQAYEMLTGKRL